MEDNMLFDIDGILSPEETEKFFEEMNKPDDAAEAE